MSKELDEKFVADHSGGTGVPAATAAEPATPAGGHAPKKKADVKKAVDAKADKLDTATPGMKEDADVAEDAAEVVEEVIEIEESIKTMFEGMDLSEEFTNKVTLVFEAAVNEAATAKSEAVIAEEVERITTELSEAADAKVEEIVENLDSYLDYVVEEWMTENELAIEAGIKVDVAESLMSGLKGLFEEHNIDVDEETLDVVADLEAQLESVKEDANKAIQENVTLTKELASHSAASVFAEMTEGLTLVEQERLKVLSEKLSFEDLDNYKSDLNTLKESFFAKKKPLVEEVNDDDQEEIITEDTTVAQPASEHSSINALLHAFEAKNI